MTARHPGTQQLVRWFSYDHLPDGRPRDVSSRYAAFAAELLLQLGDGPELTAGLRKLLEAKDCCVRQAISDAKPEWAIP